MVVVPFFVCWLLGWLVDSNSSLSTQTPPKNHLRKWTSWIVIETSSQWAHRQHLQNNNESENLNAMSQNWMELLLGNAPLVLSIYILFILILASNLSFLWTFLLVLRFFLIFTIGTNDLPAEKKIEKKNIEKIEAHTVLKFSA